jgi:hypothetical protein
MVDLVIKATSSGGQVMPSRDEWDELEKIVREQKPGFTIERRAEPKRPPRDSDKPLVGTPDIDKLKAKAKEILGQALKEDPATEASDPADQDDDIRVVSIRPVRPSDGPEPLRRPRKVIISRSARKIIAEQG